MDYWLNKEASSQSWSLAAGQLRNTAAASLRLTDVSDMALLSPKYFKSVKLCTLSSLVKRVSQHIKLVLVTEL